MNILGIQPQQSFQAKFSGKFILTSKDRHYVASAADQFHRVDPDLIITLRSSKRSKRVLVLVGEAASKFTEELSRHISEEMQKSGKNLVEIYNKAYSQLEKIYTKNRMPDKEFVVDLDKKPKSKGVIRFIYWNIGGFLLKK